MHPDPSSPVVSQERIRQELIRRASEGCEGPLDDACFRRPKMPMHIWCDPCRCNEAIKALDAATEAERVALARAAAAEQELSRLRAERTWQPIETALKNARAIIGLDWSGHAHPVFWSVARAEWVYCADGYHAGSSPRLTHWQPLPSPPGASQGSRR